MNKLELAKRLLRVAKQLWSDDVKPEWEAPKNFFKKSPDAIASGLKSNSDSYQQAMSRLTFYINRAGSNLSATDKSRLESAKAALKKLYGKDA